ncbi:hypothetical protein DFH28DRAFT_906667 [Melampsora americana]|nr:hypothetical protein DFH28DRAFT_906667 [Melampsora americana]
MAPSTRNRKKGAPTASKTPNQPTQPEEPAPATTRSNNSNRTSAPKRPQALHRSNPAKRLRNDTTSNTDEATINTLLPGADRVDETLGSTNQSDDTPTLDNYKSLMKLWPPGRIREYLQEHKKSNRNRPPTEVSDRVKLVFKQFKQELLMLAMIGQVSESTIKSYIPEMSTTRATSAYTLFLQYCSDCLIEPMPLKGQEDIGEVLGDRNQKTGAIWRALSSDERAVFQPTIFYALAGVPNPLLDDETDDVLDDDQEPQEYTGDSFVPVPKVHKLSIEEDELYRPLYERCVDLVKVENELAKPSTGPSTSQLQRRSKTAIEKISHQLSCEANRLDFAYYLVATSTVTPNKSSELGWLKQFTTHPQVASWANKTCRLATVFATYSQGVSMVKAIASVNQKPKRQRGDKQQRSDTIKVELGRLLAALTHKTLGYIPPQSFPQTADPLAEVKRRSLPISVVLQEGSRMTHEKLAVGFKKMRTGIRSEWLDDIKDGKFCLMKLRVGSDEAIGDPVALDATDVEKARNTSPRTIDKMVDPIDRNTCEPSNTNEAEKKAKKKKNRGESDSSEDSDSDEEEEE